MLLGSSDKNYFVDVVFQFSQGRSDQIGLIQRSFMYLFDRIDSISNSSNSNNNKQQQSDHVSFFLKVSYLEVYNEKVSLSHPMGNPSHSMDRVNVRKNCQPIIAHYSKFSRIRFSAREVAPYSTTGAPWRNNT